MIDVDYNEYKETLAENMKLIAENHDLKERLGIYESDSDTVIMSKEKWEETKQEIERLNNIINKALEKTKGLQYRFGYVLDDLIYILMQGSDKE